MSCQNLLNRQDCDQMDQIQMSNIQLAMFLSRRTGQMQITCETMFSEINNVSVHKHPLCYLSWHAAQFNSIQFNSIHHVKPTGQVRQVEQQFDCACAIFLGAVYRSRATSPTPSTPLDFSKCRANQRMRLNWR